MKNEVIERLRANQDEVVRSFLEELRSSHPFYRAVDDPEFSEILDQTARAGLSAFLEWLVNGGMLPEAARDEYRQGARDAAMRLVPLDAIEEPIRSGGRILWSWLVTACGDSDTGHRTALHLVEELTRFEDALQRIVTDAYVEARFQPNVGERELQRDLVEALIAGRALERELATVLTSSFRLEAGGRCVLMVAVSDGSDRGDLRRAVALAQQGAVGRRWLLADRGDEIVAVHPCHGDVLRVEEAVREWARQLARVHRIDLRVAVSTLGRLHEVQERYAEARRALALARSSPQGIVSLSTMRLFDYVAMRTEETVDRLIPAQLRSLLSEHRSGPVLVETLTALADADLKVGRAARALFVHPNTVHYRLARIRQITGLDPKRLRDLVDLLVAIRHLDSTPSSPS